jgi:hypothetical protein
MIGNGASADPVEQPPLVGAIDEAVSGGRHDG